MSIFACVRLALRPVFFVVFVSKKFLLEKKEEGGL
jgi:hypothetical protein